jgi:hypothetical protein
MPLGRYFIFAGSLLLALLFLAEQYIPEPVAGPAHTDVDRSIIRIHSRHKWPDAIVFDTSLPTITSPAVTEAVAAPASTPLRQAFALVPQPSARAAPAAMGPKPVARKRWARTGRTTIRRIASYQATAREPFLPGW